MQDFVHPLYVSLSNSNGPQPNSDGPQPNSDGLQLRSNGLNLMGIIELLVFCRVL